MWQELIGIMRALTDAYTRMERVAKAKNGALVTVNMQALEAVVAQEKAVVEEVTGLERRRQNILARMAKTVPQLAADMTMQDVIRVCPQTVAPHLIKLHRDLDARVAAVQKLGESNAFLIRNAMAAVTYHLNRVGNAAVEPTYGRQGGEIVTRAKNFDFRA